MNSKKKIRLGVNTLFLVPGDVGGTETFLRETLKALHRYHQDSLELVLFTNHENDSMLRCDFADSDSVIFRKLNFKAASRPKRILLEQFWLPYECKKMDLDLLWSPGYTAPFWSPCIQTVTIHDLQYKSFPEDMSYTERFALDILVRSACKRCSAVFTISEFSKNEVLKYGFARQEKIFPAILGVDRSFGIEVLEDENNRIIAELLPNKKPYLLCVAHSYPHKNINLLIEAFIKVEDEIPHNLVIVGKPRRGEGAIIEASEKIKVKDRLVRLQELPYRSLQVLYQNADVFILPSAYEGFGLPVIEAMVAGIPVITTQQGSLHEVGGKHATYISEITSEAIAEQIKKVLQTDSIVKKKCIGEARKWALSFTWKRSADAMVKVFENLISV